RAADVQHDAALAAVQQQERRLEVAASAVMPALGRLDLDDFGALVGQVHAGTRAGEMLREVDDAEPREHAWHVPAMLTPGGPEWFLRTRAHGCSCTRTSDADHRGF